MKNEIHKNNKEVIVHTIILKEKPLWVTTSF